MSKYMDTPHYRVNRFVSAVRVCTPAAKVISHLAGAFELTVEDLDTVVRDTAPLYTGEQVLLPLAAREEAFKLGMEHAAQRCDEEVHSGNALLREHPAVIPSQREAIERVVDAARGLAMTIRRFAADDEWRKAALAGEQIAEGATR